MNKSILDHIFVRMAHVIFQFGSYHMFQHIYVCKPVLYHKVSDKKIVLIPMVTKQFDKEQSLHDCNQVVEEPDVNNRQLLVLVRIGIGLYDRIQQSFSRQQHDMDHADWVSPYGIVLYMNDHRVEVDYIFFDREFLDVYREETKSTINPFSFFSSLIFTRNHNCDTLNHIDGHNSVEHHRVCYNHLPDVERMIQVYQQ